MAKLYAISVRGVMVSDNLTRTELVDLVCGLRGDERTDYRVFIDITTDVPTPDEISAYFSLIKDEEELHLKIDFNLGYDQMDLTMKENKLRLDSIMRLQQQFEEKEFWKSI